MDISTKYLKMCEAAQEIQDLKDLKDQKSFFTQGKMELIGKTEAACFYTDKTIWLPRQDQLQEMLGLENYSKVALVEIFLREIFFFYRDKNTSFEQLWLQFVMSRLYRKIWNEEKQEWNTKN